ncbi:MAG: MATE family efflux transporter [bacterium]
MLANITIPLVGLVDVAVMGRFPEPKFIAAVTLGATLFSAVYWLFGFLRMGTTGLAAQAFGAGNINEVVAIVLRAGAVALAIGIAIVLLQVPLQLLLFQLFEASTQVAGLARVYYEIRIYGAPGLLLYLVALGTLFGLQRMRDTLWLSIGFNLSNIILNAVLVLLLDFGVAGVALGTAISEWFAAAAGFGFVYRALRVSGWQGQRPTHIWIREDVRALFHIGSNLILRTFFVQLPFFVGTIMATGLGDVTLAAHGVLMQLFFVMTYGLDGFAHTAETLAGYAYGGRTPDNLRRTTRFCAFWAIVVAIAAGLLFWLLGHSFISLLTVSTTVQDTAAAYLPWLIISPLLCVWAFLFDGIFIGTTHIVEMRNAMVLSALIWAISLVGLFHLWAYHAVWLGMSIFMLSRSILLALYYPRIERAAAL